MTNLQKFEKLFERKKWKYKKFNFKGQEKLMLKTYHNAQRCHMFISETHIQFSFYKGYMQRHPSTNTQKLIIGAKTQYSITKRHGALQIFNYNPRNKQVRNLALFGPGALFSTMNMLINHRKVDRTNWQNKIVSSRKSRNKMFQTLDLFLAVNGFKSSEALTEANFESQLLGFSYPSMKNFPVKPSKRVSFLFRKPNMGLHKLCKFIFGHKSKLIAGMLTPTNRTEEMMDLGIMLKSKLNRGQMEKVMTFMNLAGRSSPLNYRIYHGSVVPSTKEEFLDARKFIRQFTGEQLTHLFTQSFSGFEFCDSARQWAEHPTKIVLPEKVQNWHHIHDEISRQYRKLGEADYEFKLKPIVKSIDGVEVDGEVIVVPKTRHELVDWGTVMNNCIAGYHQQFNKGQTIILGVKEQNKLKYNIEIRDGQIIQFMANRNVRADEKVINKYKKIFDNYKLTA